MSNHNQSPPKPGSTAFDNQIGAADASILKHFQPTQNLQLGNVSETAQAFKGELDTYVATCGEVAAAKKSLEQAQAKKKEQATTLHPQMKLFHLIALAAYGDNPSVLEDLGFRPPKAHVKPTEQEAIDRRLMRQQAREARKAAAAALQQQINTIKAGAMSAGSSTPASAATTGRSEVPAGVPPAAAAPANGATGQANHA